MNLDNDSPNPVSQLVLLILTQLRIGKNGLGAADVQNDVPAFGPPYNGIHQLADLLGKLLKNDFALGFPHLLKDHLFGCLGSNAAQVLGRLGNFDVVIQHEGLIHIECFLE